MFTSHFINILGRLKIQFIADKVLILGSSCTTQYQLYKFEIRYVLICQYKREAYLVYLLAVDDNSQPTLLFQFVIYLWHVLHYRLDTKGQGSPQSFIYLPLHFLHTYSSQYLSKTLIKMCLTLMNYLLTLMLIYTYSQIYFLLNLHKDCIQCLKMLPHFL